MSVELFERVADLRARVRHWHAEGERVVLVPTMGALHEGHISLTRLARLHGDRVVVSVFVNPTQFAPNEDFAAYPRTFEADREKLAAAGVDAVFHPSVAEMYPAGFATMVHVEGPAVAGLEDRFRPSHFAGVATIVSKLLLQTGPDAAVFGEKDFQQLAVIRRMVRDLDMPVEIVGAPTLREEDGLAMSSRNAYLSADERARAPGLQRAMRRAVASIEAGEDLAEVLDAAIAGLTAAGFVVDYLELRDAVSLAPIGGEPAGEMRLLAAARLGRTRLIDNIALSL